MARRIIGQMSSNAEKSDKILVEYPLEGGSILVEVDQDPATGPLPASTAGDRIKKAEETFSQAISNLKPLAKAALDQITTLSPDQATIEFGIKLAAKGGIILASAETEGHFKITLSWKKPS